MQTVLITGGTGLVGNALTAMLVEKGYNVIILTRNLEGKNNRHNVNYALWNLKNNEIDTDALQKADYIIHLAGAGVVDKKWTEAYKKTIVDSRTKSSQLIYDHLKNMTHKVKAFISSSAIGWYGEDEDPARPFVESDPAADNFLGITCRLWEEGAEQFQELGIRVAKLRTGIVLSNDGGALEEFKKPLLFRVAAILGSGKQAISWIHIEDLCRMFIFVLENGITGSYNAVAPETVSNKELNHTLAETMYGKYYLPLNVPSFVLKIMLGQRSTEILKSTTVSAKKIIEAGFNFNFNNIKNAAADLLIK